MTEEQEIEGVGRMIAYYCKKKHGGDGKTLCPECQELYEYVKVRRHACPFGDDKPFCSACKIHCYKPDMREKIRAVMRFAAPRVTLFHPIMSLKHLLQTKKRAKEIKAEEAEREARKAAALEKAKVILAEREAKAKAEAEAKACDSAEQNNLSTTPLDASAIVDSTPKSVENTEGENNGR